MRKIILLKGVSFFLLFFLAACSNTKDTRLSRLFHNTTSHYNGYYHARLKIKEGVDRLADQHEDKYDRILKMYRYADATKAKSIYPLMDEAIKKLSTVITRHTILDKSGNEKPDSEKWIDDNWLVYGQAEFYKHDYFAALETFEFVESTYRNSPTRHLASLWIVKTYLELTQLNEAESKLDYLRNTKDFPSKARGDLYAVSADYYLQVRNFPKAIEYLNKAVEHAKLRQDRIRFLFILGQVYQKENESVKAFDTYTRCIKMNPKYEMEFNARINRARCYTPYQKKAINIKQELLKMEKDPKNKEYLDQVYYALASIALKEKDEIAAIDYLNKSISASIGNTSQKAQTFLELGRIYLARPLYKTAQAYYDSCVTYISQDHPDYEIVVNKRNSLTRLIRFLNTIEREDSLQQVAKMNGAEVDAKVDDILKKEEEQKRIEKEKENAKSAEQIFGNKTGVPSTATGSWYFYNPSTISFGFNDFLKKWGNRKLEDNWRRSQKEQELAGSEEFQNTGKPKGPATDSAGAQEAMAAKEARKLELRGNLPVTPELVEKSNNKIIEAYYNAALIYKDQLDDARASMKMFEELLRRFPHCKYEVQCYYQLYKLYGSAGNQAKSDYYKNLILNEHGDTEYAEMIRNPNYGADKAKEKSKLELYYEETYRKFLNGEYTTVIQRREDALKEFPENSLMPKFDLLKTLSIGRTASLGTFQSSLMDIVRIHPDDPVKDRAQEILDYIESLSEKKAEEIETALVKDSATLQKYNYNPDTTHFIMVVFPIAGMNAVEMQKKITDYNNKYFSLKAYSTTNLVLDNKNQVILIRNFFDKADAVAYSNDVYNNDEVYGNLSPDKYQHILISQINYAVLMKDRKMNEYLDFYNRFYK